MSAQAWTWGRFLRARVVPVLFCLAGMVICFGILAVAGVVLSLRLLIIAILLAFLILALTAGYLRERSFWRDLQGLAEGLDRSWQLPSLVELPEFPEGQVAYDALRSMGAAASDEVHASAQQMADYRDYIELWVHEIKAPIASAQLVADRLPGADAALLKTDLERINRDVEQALFFARSTSLERDFSVSAFALAPVARRACKDNARFLIDAGCLPVFEIPEETVAFGDSKWVGFILSQLVVNAAKYGATEVRFTTWLEDGPAASEEGDLAATLDSLKAIEPAERGEACCEAAAVAESPADSDCVAEAPAGSDCVAEALADSDCVAEARGGMDFDAVPSSAQMVYLEVADNGTGIPAADVPRVFDRGFTGQNGRAYSAATGMGLYLCAVMCRKMGLSIEIASEEGAGTRVILGFPFDRRRLDDASVR